MSLDIDVNFDFTTDSNFWATYSKGRSESDPDTNSPTLRRYHQMLYSRQTPSGKILKLEQGKNKYNDYLVCDGVRYSSDSILNMYSYRLPEIEKEIENFDDLIIKFKHDGYTIGGEIIFPKHNIKLYGQTMNQRRGWCPQIKDRFDLTLECIRRFYNGEDNPLSDVLKADEDFFKMFVDFRGYVDFFFLNDLVSEDYKKVKLFFGTYEDIFKRSPFPQNKQEWEQLFESQKQFLNKRNERIKRFCQKQ